MTGTLTTVGNNLEHTEPQLWIWILDIYFVAMNKKVIDNLVLKQKLGDSGKPVARVKHLHMQDMSKRKDKKLLANPVQVSGGSVGGELEDIRGQSAMRKLSFVAELRTPDFLQPKPVKLPTIYGHSFDAAQRWFRCNVAHDSKISSDRLRFFRANSYTGSKRTTAATGDTRGTKILSDYHRA